MNFKDSFLLLLLVGFCSATVHLQEEILEAGPKNFCLNPVSLQEQCSFGYLNQMNCLNISMEVGVSSDMDINLFSSGRSVFSIRGMDHLARLNDYAKYIFCKQPVQPMIFGKMDSTSGPDVWLQLKPSVILRKNSNRKSAIENRREIHITCGLLTEISVHEPKAWNDSLKLSKEQAHLAWAAGFCDFETVRNLVSKDSNIIRNLENANTSASLFAADCCNEHFLLFLLQRGASPGAVADNGYTPLILAAKSGNIETVRLLLKVHSSNVNDADSELRKTALHFAAEHDIPELSNLLISSGADIFARDVNGWSALHMAAFSGSSKVIRVLIESGIPIDDKTHTGRTPLMLAAEQSRAACVEVLISLGADPKTIDSEDKSVLEYAHDGIIIKAILKALRA